MYVSNKAGRNNTGRVVARSKGCRARSGIRILNSYIHSNSTPGIVCRLEYDPFRSSFISLVVYSNNICSYVLHTYGTLPGSRVMSAFDFSTCDLGIQFTVFNNGDSTSLLCTPHGTVLHDVELFPGAGGSIARAAGTYCLLLKKFLNIKKCFIRLPSESTMSISSTCYGTKGIVGNEENNKVVFGKAGRRKLRGFKPIVRGVAMNPVDHSHGGGEGKKSKQCHPRTAWGKMLH